ncbi:MAG: hypothetical protein IJX63_00365 [Lachnospiraceae bacterium]|nr:hypothetical protein [Lachnospiraceae bacterium]
MTLVLIEADMEKIRQFPVEWVPEQIDAILRPYHLQWAYGNYYEVEEGYDAESSVQGAIDALQNTGWLKAALTIRVVRLVVKRKLSSLNVEDMSPPTKEKLDRLRGIFQRNGLTEDKLAYPNPITIDEENRLLDGYTTYLLMQERGFQEAVCLLLKGDIH